LDMAKLWWMIPANPYFVVATEFILIH
jgi:hypothetical protein